MPTRAHKGGPSVLKSVVEVVVALERERLCEGLLLLLLLCVLVWNDAAAATPQARSRLALSASGPCPRPCLHVLASTRP